MTGSSSSLEASLPALKRSQLPWGAGVPKAFLAAALLSSLVFGLLSGCQTYPLRREPLTTAQILQMSAEKRPPEEIIDRIRESRTVYILHARDVKDLLDKGVDERVVDEMLRTRLRDLESYYRSYYYPYHYGPYFGFGYGFSF